MNDHKDYEYPFPNETTKSEFDITEQIFRTTKAYNITADYEWVRGHQDRHKEYEKLDTYTKLNVQADHLAGDYQDRKGTFRPLAPVLPSCPAMISIRGISVTSNIFKQLVRAYTEPRYMGYLQTKHNWTDSTVQSIVWKSLSLAIDRIDRNVLLTKVCNNILPTFHQLYRFGMHNSNKCPLCDADETMQHMIQCEHLSRTSWRCGLIKALRTKMTATNTTFSLLDTFVSAICDWMKNGFVNIRKYPYHYREAIHQQDRIGWDHLFTGKIYQEWL